MEEKIIEILNDHFGWHSKELFEQTSKEIAGHFEKFIEWMWFEKHQFRPYYDNKLNKHSDFYNGEDNMVYTLKELHQYYCDNVLNLKDK